MRWASGVLGVEPWAWTLRDLVGAAVARWRYDWDQTSHLLWIQAEINRDRKARRRPFLPSEFHPDSSTRKPESSSRSTLTREVFRAQARAWFQRQGLPLPEKLQ